VRFLLVNPFYPLTEMPSPPLGVAYVAAALERAGVEVKVLDLVVQAYSKSRLAFLLREFRPHVVGATAVTMSFDSAIGVIKDVKGIDPSIPTVMGGPHISFCAPEMMTEHPELDVAVLGEGEETVVELAAALDRGGGGLDRIPGLVYRDGDRLRATGERPPRIDVNSLPLPARHLLPLGRYRALGTAVSMTTSRGCPFRCIFCVGRKMVGAKVRYRNAVSVVDEMQQIGSLGFSQINVVDDLFTINEKHCFAVCDEILARGLDLKWTSFARADTVSVEVLRRMKEAGCHMISFGFESSSPEILKAVRKGITVEQMLEAARMCQQVGIKAHASFILGLPGETMQTVKQTVDLCKELEKLDLAAGFHLLAPFPGTLVREKSDEYGIKILTNDWSQYHANRAVTETEGAKREALDELVMEYEDDVLEEIGEREERIRKNQASQEDIEFIAKLNHMGVIYELMMNGVIESSGEWLAGKGELPRREALYTLAGKMRGVSAYKEPQIVDTLEYALERGFLRNCKGGGRRLEWVEHL
jgi:anaerobic magnesium-protoporphyrin IX monomethyl ester cyclase